MRALWLTLLLCAAAAVAAEPGAKEVFEGFHPAFPGATGRLRVKQAIVERCIAQGQTVALLRNLKRMEPALAAIQKRIDADYAAYLDSGKKFFGWRANYERDFVRKHGSMPSEYPTPQGIQKDFIKRELALKKSLSVKRAEREFQRWVEERLAKLMEGGAPEGAVSALAAGLKGKDAVLQVRCAALLGRSRETAAAAALDRAAGSLRDSGVLAAVLEARGAVGGDGALTALGGALSHAAWPVRAGAVRGLQRLGGDEAIGLLEKRLASERGRLLDDIRFALSAEGAATDEGPVLFLGIRMHTEAVVYCVDGSDAEAWESVARLTTESIQTLPDRARFGLVVYGREVTRFRKKLSDANGTNRAAAAEFLKRFEPAPPRFEGNADLYAGLMAAFDLAGGGKGQPPQADTICCMTLRGPSTGLFDQPIQLAQEILARNRPLGIRVQAYGPSPAKHQHYLQRIAGQFGGSWVGSG